MRYEHVIQGRFLARPNRFIAQVEIQGQMQTVHVKNTGRCRELRCIWSRGGHRGGRLPSI